MKTKINKLQLALYDILSSVDVSKLDASNERDVYCAMRDLLINLEACEFEENTTASLVIGDVNLNEDEWYRSDYQPDDIAENFSYYIHKDDHSFGDIGYMRSSDGTFTKLKIVHIISLSENKAAYQLLSDDVDVLFKGEKMFEADTSAEFYTADDMFIVWFKIVDDSHNRKISIDIGDNMYTITEGDEIVRGRMPNRISNDVPAQIMIAFANYLGYEPGNLLMFDDNSIFNSDNVSDDEVTNSDDVSNDEDNNTEDYLKQTDDELIDIWIKALLKDTGAESTTALTRHDLEEEIKEVEGTIRNECLVALTTNNSTNIATLIMYLNTLKQMLDNIKED